MEPMSAPVEASTSMTRPGAAPNAAISFLDSTPLTLRKRSLEDSLAYWKRQRETFEERIAHTKMMIEAVDAMIEQALSARQPSSSRSS